MDHLGISGVTALMHYVVSRDACFETFGVFGSSFALICNNRVKIVTFALTMNDKFAFPPQLSTLPPRRARLDPLPVGLQ